MCGVFGQYSDHRIEHRHNVKLIEKLIFHRGPDAFSSKLFDKFSFGAFSRLSINDLTENSAQPMSSKCGNFHLMFNGEIYNYKELRKTLINKGWRFKSTGDTEVLLAGLIIYGTKFINKLDGIFAFSFYDLKQETLILCRDRMGIKPLYYSTIKSNEGQSVVFGSEIKFLSKYYLEKATLNKELLTEYFKYKYVTGEQTLIKNIKSIEAGHYIKFEKQKLLYPKKTQFYDICKIEPTKIKHKDLKEKIFATLKKSVFDQFQCDANIGLQISGGVDSTIIAGMANELKIMPHDSYFVSMENSIHDESQYANEVSKKFFYPINTVKLNEVNYFNTISKVAYFHDTPINHPHCVALYLLSKLASQKLKVLVSGEGADELCLGYLRYNLNLVNSDRDILTNYSFLRKNEEINTLNKLLNFKDFPDPDLSRKKILKKIPDYPIMSKLRLYEMQTHLQDLLLRLDRMLMANSIEGRVPFLSNDFIELCLSYEASTFYEGFSGKSQLKLICDDFMGNNFSSRKKVGFMIPLNEWVGTSIYKKNLTKIKNMADLDFINSDIFLEIYSNLSEEKNVDTNMKFYSLFSNLDMWLKDHSVDWS